MPRTHIIKATAIKRTPRVQQLEGLFDIAPSPSASVEWHIDFTLPEHWHIGLIVAPSGSGKTSVAESVFGDAIVNEFQWPADAAVIDGFPDHYGIKDITELLNSVGFSSPPSWLKPYHVLSTGEKFRVHIARALAENLPVTVIDEFTSVIDRTVAQIGSAAVAKMVRKNNRQFIAVTCHYDVIDWLAPDWIYQPHTNTFTINDGRLLRRPDVTLEIKRVHHSAWQFFAPHHYLSAGHSHGAVCFCAFYNDQPVAFTSWLHFVHSKKINTKRAHRTVCLPDYQGIGIGNALVNTIASMWSGLGYTAISTTSHPAMIKSRIASKQWKVTKKASINSGFDTSIEKKLNQSRASNRMTWSFQYIGHAMPKDQAERLLKGH
jgi:GNAT superfamily N-acetyltransferase